MAPERRLTTSRLGRLTQMGRVATGIAGAMVGEGARQLAQGRRPSVGELLLTPANARRLGDRLSEMRGAAMKVGQLLSMDSGQLLPPQLAEMLARLRENAHPMPIPQVAQALKQAWGKDWEREVTRFSFTPLAAASIGQVHEAVLRDGRHLAVKIQYPGIRRSIDTDVDNVATLLRLSNLVPEAIDFAPLLEEAKRQLHAEADYVQEADALERFARLVAEDPRFDVPEVVRALSTTEVLALRFLDGQPIETLAAADPQERDGAASALLELAVREVFEWGIVQTDPNFANYLHQPATGRIQLLDFGATRAYPADQRTALTRLMKAGIDGTERDLAESAIAVGYLDESDPPAYRSSVIALLRAATEPARSRGRYDFGNTELAGRMKELVVEMRLRNGFGRIPPPGILFLHRKLGGLYMLLARLRARVPVRDIVGSRIA